MVTGGLPRILAVNHTALVSGAEAVMLRVLSAARSRGWSVVVACPRGPLSGQVVAAGMEWLEIPDLMLGAARRPIAAAGLALRHLRASRRLRRAADRADLVVANGIRVLPTLRLARPRAPVVWLAHNLVDRPRWLRLVRACAPVVDLVLAGSTAVVKSLARSDLDTAVVPYGTPWPVAPAPPGPPDPPVVGCAALLTSWKGQEVLLDAVARLGRPDIIVELMGGSFPKDIAYIDALRQRASEPDLAGRVRFTGHVDDALDAMRGWTVAVVASTDPEAGPLSMLEAMSVGIPVVATDHGGPPELLGEAGLLVPPGDTDAMAAALGRLLDDADLYRRCAEAGPRRVADGLTLDGQVAGLLDAFENLLRPAHGPGRAPLSRRRGRRGGPARSGPGW